MVKKNLLFITYSFTNSNLLNVLSWRLALFVDFVELNSMYFGEYPVGCRVGVAPLLGGDGGGGGLEVWEVQRYPLTTSGCYYSQILKA